MGWTLGYREPEHPDLVRGALLAAGKALYLANEFERKCTSVLRIGRLVSMIREDPVLSLMEAMDALPADPKTLAPTLTQLSQTALGGSYSDKSEVLSKAREARNFIAHKGAAFGSLWAINPDTIGTQLVKLRSAVQDLIAGDNIVSSWIYEIENKERAPELTQQQYPQWVDPTLIKGPGFGWL